MAGPSDNEERRSPGVLPAVVTGSLSHVLSGFDIRTECTPNKHDDGTPVNSQAMASSQKAVRRICRWQAGGGLRSERCGHVVRDNAVLAKCSPFVGVQRNDRTPSPDCISLNTLCQPPQGGRADLRRQDVVHGGEQSASRLRTGLLKERRNVWVLRKNVVGPVGKLLATKAKHIVTPSYPE